MFPQADKIPVVVAIKSKTMESEGVKDKIRSFFEEKTQHGETGFSTYFMKISKFVRLLGVLPIREKSINVRVLKRVSIHALVGLPLSILVLVVLANYSMKLALFSHTHGMKDMFPHWHTYSEVLMFLLFITIIYSFTVQASTFFDLMEQWQNISESFQQSLQTRPYFKICTICQLFIPVAVLITSYILIVSAYEKAVSLSQETVTMATVLQAVVICISRMLQTSILVTSTGIIIFLLFSLKFFIVEYNIHLEKCMESYVTRDELVGNRKLHLVMYKLSKDLNKAIDPILAMLTLFILVTVIFTCYGLIMTSMSTFLRAGFTVAMLTMMIFVITLCEGGHEISYQSGKTEQILHRKSFAYNFQLSEEMRMFIVQVKMFPIRIQVGGFVSLDRSLLVTCIGIISTYFIVLLQFSS